MPRVPRAAPWPPRPRGYSRGALGRRGRPLANVRSAASWSPKRQSRQRLPCPWCRRGASAASAASGSTTAAIGSMSGTISSVASCAACASPPPPWRAARRRSARVSGEDRARRREQRAAVGILERQLADHLAIAGAREIRRGVYCEHARHVHCRADFDAVQPAMGMGRADHARECLARHVDVVGVAALAAQQPRVLLAVYRLADTELEVRQRYRIVHGCARPVVRVPAVAGQHRRARPKDNAWLPECGLPRIWQFRLLEQLCPIRLASARLPRACARLLQMATVTSEITKIFHPSGVLVHA